MFIGMDLKVLALFLAVSSALPFSALGTSGASTDVGSIDTEPPQQLNSHLVTRELADAFNAEKEVSQIHKRALTPDELKQKAREIYGQHEKLEETKISEFTNHLIQAKQNVADRPALSRSVAELTTGDPEMHRLMKLADVRSNARLETLGQFNKMQNTVPARW